MCLRPVPLSNVHRHLTIDRDAGPASWGAALGEVQGGGMEGGRTQSVGLESQERCGDCTGGILRMILSCW